MTIRQVIRLFQRNLFWILGGALLTASLVFLLTLGQERTYESRSEIYTGIASGVNLNNVDDLRSDFFAISSEFDNMMSVVRSQQTLEEVGEKLLAQEVLNWSRGERTDNEYAAWIPEEIWQSWLEVPHRDSVWIHIREFLNSEEHPELRDWLFEKAWSPYSAKAIGSVNVNRIGNSDFLEISYQWKDPYITQKTLEILNEVFLGRIANIKKRQANNVVEYFRVQTEEARRRLQSAEEYLRDFRVDNDIINYDEQTKQLAVMKERLEDEQQKEQASYEAAIAAVEEIETKLANHREIVRFSDDLLQKRQELSDINTRVALMEIYYRDESEVTALREEADRLREELSDLLRTRYDLGRSTEGIPVAQLLDEWLEATLSADRSQAHLKVFAERMEYFREQYEQFAPLGSNLSRIEREIGVHEKNYLELLRSYNQALMRLENEEVASGGAVVTVAPKFPLEPIPTKRKILVILGFLVGGLVPIGFLFLKAFMDRALRNAVYARSRIGREVIGGFPSKEEESGKGGDVSYAVRRASVMTMQNILKDGATGAVIFFQTSASQATVPVLERMGNDLRSSGLEVITVGPEGTGLEESYTAEDMRSGKLSSFARSFGKDKLVLLLLPPLLDSPIHHTWLPESFKYIALVNAAREWYKSDSIALQEFVSMTKSDPSVVLFNMRIEDVEGLIGEVPQRYNWLFRKLLKYLPK